MQIKKQKKLKLKDVRRPFIPRLFKCCHPIPRTAIKKVRGHLKKWKRSIISEDFTVPTLSKSHTNLQSFYVPGYKYGFLEKRVLFCLRFLLFVSQLKHLPALTYSYRFHMKSQEYEQFYQSLKWFFPEKHLFYYKCINLLWLLQACVNKTGLFYKVRYHFCEKKEWRKRSFLFISCGKRVLRVTAYQVKWSAFFQPSFCPHVIFLHVSYTEYIS